MYPLLTWDSLVIELKVVKTLLSIYHYITSYLDFVYYIL